MCVPFFTSLSLVMYLLFIHFCVARVRFSLVLDKGMLYLGVSESERNVCFDS